MEQVESGTICLIFNFSKKINFWNVVEFETIDFQKEPLARLKKGIASGNKIYDSVK